MLSVKTLRSLYIQYAIRKWHLIFSTYWLNGLEMPFRVWLSENDLLIHHKLLISSLIDCLRVEPRLGLKKSKNMWFSSCLMKQKFIEGLKGDNITSFEGKWLIASPKYWLVDWLIEQGVGGECAASCCSGRGRTCENDIDWLCWAGSRRGMCGVMLCWPWADPAFPGPATIRISQVRFPQSRVPDPEPVP